MKRKTLSIVAALFMCACGAWAQTWDAKNLKISSPIENGDFKAGTVFYTIKGMGDNGGYLRSDELDSNNRLSVRGAAPTGDEGRWAIIGSVDNGFQFVNKATKTAIALSKDYTKSNLNDAPNRTANASWLTDNFEDANTYFDIAAHVNIDGQWVISAHNDNYYFWNDLTHLGYWYSEANYGYYGWDATAANPKAEGDRGASFQITEVEEYIPLPADVAEAKAAWVAASAEANALFDEYGDLADSNEEVAAALDALYEAVTEYYYIEEETVENYNAATAAIKAAVATADAALKAATQEPEMTLDEAKAAYKAAKDEYTALVAQYSDLTSSNSEVYEVMQTLNEELEGAWIIDFDGTATAEQYQTAANTIKNAVNKARADFEAAVNPAAPVFPAAGDYYVYIKNYDTARNPYLYNNVDEETGLTLQAANLNNANNGYIWHVTSDGSGNVTSIVNGTGKGVGVNVEAGNQFLTSLVYEDAGEGYYYLGNSVLGELSWLNASNGGQNNGKGTRTVTNYSKENASKWMLEPVNTEGLTAYNVVVEGNEAGLAVLNGEYAGNNGFFLTTSVEGVDAKEIKHYTYTVNVEEATKTIKVTYTATVDPITVTYNVYVGDDKVGTFTKTEYVGDATSFVVPDYVNAVVPEVVPENGTVEIRSSYKEGALPFDVNGNYNLALNRTPNLNIYVGAEGGIHTEAVASTEETKANYVWTIGGDWYNGFTIKSVAADKYVSYGSANPAENSHAALMDEAGEGATFDLVQAGGRNYFKIHGTTNEAYISNYGGAKTTFLTNWNSASNIGDAGAQFIFTKVEAAPEVDPELAEALEEFYALTGEWVDDIRNKYSSYARTGTPASDALSELNDLLFGYAKVAVPKNMDEIYEAYEAVQDGMLKFYESCTVEILVKVIEAGKTSEDPEDDTLVKVEELKAGILKTFSGAGSLSNKK